MQASSYPDMCSMDSIICFLMQLLHVTIALVTFEALCPCGDAQSHLPACASSAGKSWEATSLLGYQSKKHHFPCNGLPVNNSV